MKSKLDHRKPHALKSGIRANGKKIIFVVNDMNFFCSHRLKVAQAATIEGYEVLLLCPMGESLQQITDSGIRHFPLPLSRGRGSIITDFIATIKLARILSNEDPDIVHLVTAKPIIVGGILARLLGIPVVAAISGLGHVFISNRLKTKILRNIVMLGYKLALRRNNAWAIFQNDENKALFLKSGALKQNPVMIRGMGVDLALFDPSPPLNSVPKVLMPCRMIATKGIYEFVEACRIIKGKGINVECMLLGDPDPANPANIDIKTLLTWNKSGLITWRAHIPSISAIMQSSDIIALPSYNEGFPKTLIDAAAAGRPAVATDVTGCRDAIIDGVTGLLAAPQDSESLASKLTILLENKSLRQKMGRAARSHAEKNFSIEKIAKEHLNLYERITCSKIIS